MKLFGQEVKHVLLGEYSYVSFKQDSTQFNSFVKNKFGGHPIIQFFFDNFKYTDLLIS